MKLSSKWVVVGTAAVLGTGGTLAAAALTLNDGPNRGTDASAVVLSPGALDQTSVTVAPDKTSTAAPSTAPAKPAAKKTSAAAPKASVASADTPAAAPVRPRIQTVASADSPAPVVKKAKPAPLSANSPVSASSPVSANSPD